MGSWVMIICPTCGRSLSPEKWKKISRMKSKGLATIWESLGRAALNFISRLFSPKGLEEELEPVKYRLLRAVRNYYNAGIITRSDLMDLLDDLYKDDEDAASVRAEPTFYTKGKHTFHNVSADL